MAVPPAGFDRSHMPNYDKLLQANLPQALESAWESVDGIYDYPAELLKADVARFESMALCAFMYFTRDDLFYVNAAGRELLKPKQTTFGPESARSPLVFWLEEDPALQAADDFVASRHSPLFETRELVTLPWGKTWLQGTKFPVRSRAGQPIAFLFGGKELLPSQQIRLVADHYQSSQQGFGDN